MGRQGRKIDRELREVLGEDRMVRFVQEFGGTRVMISSGTFHDKETGDLRDIIAQRCGADIAEKLRNYFGTGYTLVVPLMRELRAKRMRDAGASMAQIARELGITENGAIKLIARVMRDGQRV